MLQLWWAIEQWTDVSAYLQSWMLWLEFAGNRFYERFTLMPARMGMHCILCRLESATAMRKPSR